MHMYSKLLQLSNEDKYKHNLSRTIYRCTNKLIPRTTKSIYHPLTCTILVLQGYVQQPEFKIKQVFDNNSPSFFSILEEGSVPTVCALSQKKR